MSKKPVLVIMAAGMGSRYGGLKQIDPVDQEGHIIMDFSIYDAVRVGFKKVIFIINCRISVKYMKDLKSICGIVILPKKRCWMYWRERYVTQNFLRGA